MGLTRDDFENDRLRHWLRTDHPDFAILSEQDLADSLERSLAERPPGEAIWVFGYGSLIWNPLFRHVEQRVARLNGFHRRFCIWSRAYRGTPLLPGLVLGLDAGGACRGIAYRLDAAVARRELELLWRREMVSNAYRPRWLRVTAGDEAIHALAFVVNRGNPVYAGKLSMDEVASIMAVARGRIGTCAEYLRETLQALQAHGLSDAYLVNLQRRLEGSADDLPPSATDRPPTP